MTGRRAIVAELHSHANARADTRESAHISLPASTFFVIIEMKANVGGQIPQVPEERRADPLGI